MSSHVQVRRVTDAADIPQTIHEEMEGVLQQIRERAFSLFQERGGDSGRDVEDWLEAERAVIGSATSELTEDASVYHVRIALPGYSATDVRVTATQNELIVKAETTRREERTETETATAESSSMTLFRKFDLSEDIDAALVTAILAKGVLEIEARKAVQQKQIGQAA